MKLEEKYLKFCAEQGRRIIDLYAKSASEPKEKQKSHHDLEWIVREDCQKQIYLRELQVVWNACHVRAFVIKKGSHYEIYLGSEMPESILRWYKCKELFQIVLDSPAFPEFRTTDLVDHIGKMVLRAQPESSDLGIGPTAIGETLAELAAVEFLIPHADRVKLRHSHSAGNTDYKKIAEDYGLFQSLVEWTMTDEFMATMAPYFGI
jgi:hypothetical protein